MEIHTNPGLALVAAAAVVLYIASRAAADSLVGAREPSAGRLAIGHWLPIAAVALLAMMGNRSEVAIRVIFASSVASISLGIGAITVLAPVTPTAGTRKRWPMVLPVALLVFLMGFRGKLALLHVVVLAIEGLVVFLLWNDSGSPGNNSAEPAAPKPITSEKFSPLRVIQFSLAAVLAGLGALAAVRGTDQASHASDFTSAGLLAATILSPLLVLPMLGAGVDLAHGGRSGVAVTSQVGVVLLNMCLLLPLVVLEGQYHPLRMLAMTVRSQVLENEPIAASPTTAPTGLPASTQPALVRSSSTQATSQPTTLPIAEDEPEPVAAADGIPYPLAVWRVDAIVLIVLGLFLLPMGLGFWRLSKAEGFALIGGYMAYLLMSMLLVRGML